MLSLQQSLKMLKMSPKNLSCDNLTKDERQALVSFQNKENIVITIADKGRAIVIWGLQEYINEAQKQLSNKIYKQLDFDSSEDWARACKAVVYAHYVSLCYVPREQVSPPSSLEMPSVLCLLYMHCMFPQYNSFSLLFAHSIQVTLYVIP